MAGRIALRARHAGAATWASVRTFPKLIRMVLADPADIVATNALHANEGGHSLKFIDVSSFRPATPKPLSASNNALVRNEDIGQEAPRWGEFQT